MNENNSFRLCRLCLKCGDWTVDLFDQKRVESPLLRSLITELVEFEALEDDGLPQSICDDCINKLYDLKKLKKMCIRSRDRFLNLQLLYGVVVNVQMSDNVSYCMCRLCLKYGNWTTDVFDQNKSDGSLVCSVITELVKIHAFRDDGLPQNVCDACMSKLFIFKNFKEVCISSKNKLLSLQTTPVVVVPVAIERAACGDALKSDSPEPCSNWVQVKVEPGSSEHMVDTEEILGGEGDPLSLRDPLSLDDDKPEEEVNIEPGCKDESVDAECLVDNKLEVHSPIDPPEPAVVKAEESNVSAHDLKVEPSNDEDGHVGSGTSLYDEEDTGQNFSPGFPSSPAVKEEEEDETASIAAFAASICDASMQQTGSAIGESIHGWGDGEGLSSLGQLGSSEMFPCHKCSASFSCSTALYTHMIGHPSGSEDIGPCDRGEQSHWNEDGTYFPGPISKEVFATPWDLIRHMRRNQSKFICDHCEKPYIKKVHLINHIRFVHLNIPNPQRKAMSKGRSFVCDCCGKGYYTKDDLSRHIDVVHLEVFPFCCNVCSKGFSVKSKLIIHIQTAHTTEKNLKCDVCGKAFKRADKLRYHTLTHLKQRPFPCTLCPRSYVSNYKLRAHMETHSGVKHTCELCWKEFTDKKVLQNHIRRHSQKSYKCQDCSQEFMTRTDLSNHSWVHSELHTHSCPVCGKKFIHKSRLRDHMQRHNGLKPFECEVCQKRFGMIWALKKHMFRHGERSHECKQCHKRFYTKYDLKTHLNDHLPEAEMFKCEECPKSFKRKDYLKSHMRVHNKKREVFTCEECGMRTKSKYYLKKHTESIHGNPENEGMKMDLSNALAAV